MRIDTIPIAVIVFISCIVSACVQETKKPVNNIIDNTIKKYIIRIDTLHSSTEPSYVTLKKYIEKDTVYFIHLNEKIHKWDSVIKIQNELEKYPLVQPLAKSNADEAYRFWLWQTFKNYRIIVTILKQGNSATLHYLRYKSDFIAPDGALYSINDTSKIIKSFEKKISTSQWDTLLHKISYCDYWGMREHEDKLSLDGDSWSIEAIKKDDLRNESTFPYIQQNIYRTSPENTAFGEVGLYLIQLSGEKIF